MFDVGDCLFDVGDYHFLHVIGTLYMIPAIVLHLFIYKVVLIQTK